MKFYLYKALLWLLNMLILAKRGLFWLLGKIGVFLSWSWSHYNRTIGFRLYKFWFNLSRKISKHKLPLDSRLLELVGTRTFLQFVAFVVALVIMYPNSQLYSQDITHIPGKDTILYSLVSPSDYDEGAEEIIVEEAGLALEQLEEPEWKQGAVAIDTAPISGQAVVTNEIQEISGVSAGGLALTKPSILPGSELPEFGVGEEIVTDNSKVSGSRKEPLIYVVQSGDTISQIAQKFGISQSTLLWANNLSVRSYLRPRQELRILPTSGVEHKVKSGDTVIKIAKTYDADVDDIIEFNNLAAGGADIVVGELLVIPGGELQYSAPVVAKTPSRNIPVVSEITNKIQQQVAPPSSAETPAGTGYVWPSTVKYISQYSKWGHYALDIAGPVGSPIYATKAGTVTKAICSGWNYGYGCYVMIDHGGGVQSLYAHNSKLFVESGDKVEQGQTISLMGSTGNSTGPHLHFEIRVNGNRQNPLRFVRN